MVDVKNVSKSYGKQIVLKNISLNIGKGEIFGLLGPSGAGKTTLIRLITGSEQTDSGDVFISDKKVPGFDALKLLGYMPQNDGLYPEISGEDNLAFFGGLFGMKGSRLKEAIAEKLALVDLTQDAKKLVQKYSGGMKKRLSLAASLLHNPKLLILDEPTVGIDPILKHKIWEELAHQKSLGVTLIVTTHVMDEVSYCDHAALIRNGEVLACETIPKLLELSGGNIENLFFDNTLKAEGNA